MTSKEQCLVYLRQYLKARQVVPWIARYAEWDMPSKLQALGGIAGTWRTDYSECMYDSPQLMDGVLVDLSTVEKVRSFHESRKAIA